VAGGKAENANFTFKAAGADAGKEINNPATADVKLASFQAKADPKAAATKACCETGPTSKAAALKSVAKAKAEQPQAAAK
jgi:hypothetical protein